MEPVFYILSVEMRYPNTSCTWAHIYTQFLGVYTTIEKCIEKANEVISPSYNKGQPIVWDDPVGFWDGKYQSHPVNTIEEGENVTRTDTYIIQRCWPQNTDVVR